MSTTVFLVNPAAGRGLTDRRWPLIETTLERSSIPYEVFFSEHPYELEQHARACALEPIRALVAVGGDGTINAVVNGLAHAMTAGSGYLPLGIIPIGEQNDLARMLGIPLEPVAALDRLTNDRTIRIDVGSVRLEGRIGEERFFVNGMGIGLEALIAARLEQRRYLTGRPAFLLSLLEATRAAEPMTLAMTVEGIRRTLHLSSLTIANGACQVGHLLLTPRAAINDGKFNLCLVRSMGGRPAFRLMLRAMRARHVSDAAVSIKRTARLLIESDQPLLFHLDGEPWLPETSRRVEVELLPEWLAVLV